MTLTKIARSARSSLKSATGAKGEKGAIGPAGPKGEKGDPGPAIDGVPVAGANIAANGLVLRFFNRFGGAPTVKHLSGGVYTLEFPGLIGRVSSESSLVTASLNGSSGEISTTSLNGNPQVHTFESAGGGPNDHAFEITVVLPDP